MATVSSREYHQNYVRQERVVAGKGASGYVASSMERRIEPPARPSIDRHAIDRPSIDYESYAHRLANNQGTYRSTYSAHSTMSNGAYGAAGGYYGGGGSLGRHRMEHHTYANGGVDLSPGSKASHRTTQDFSESSSFDDRYDRNKVLRKVKKTRSDRNRNLATTGEKSQSHQELRTNGIGEFSASTKRSRIIGSAEDLSRSFHADVDRLNEQLDVILNKIDALETRTTKLTHADRHLVEEVVAELDALSAPIEGLFSDVEGSKDTSVHTKAYGMVMGLQQRRLAYLNKLGALGSGIGLIINRSGRSVTTIEEEAEERYIQKATRVFNTCEECTEWIMEITEELLQMQFPFDLEPLEELLEKHRVVHRDVVDFRQEVDQNIARQAAVSAEDSFDYCDLLATLERNYEELRELSTGRMVDLDSLVAFVRLSLLELGWVGERVVPEVSRDWADVNQLDLPVLENYYRQLLHEIELHEVQFNVTFNQGTALIRQEHPASNVVEKYLEMMQREWDWLLALAKCFEVHLQDSVTLKEILEEASKIDYWIDQQTKYLETKFERSTVTLEEGEQLLKDLEEWKIVMDKYHTVLVDLLQRCETVSPMWQRGERITSPIPVRALVDYEDSHVTIRAGDQVQLVDNSDLVNWVVRVGGVQARVPSVVFRVPPPDTRLASLLDRLRVKFESLNKLWISKHMHIQYLMFSSNCRTIRSWDLERFLSYTEEQRESIMKALNTDGQRLLSELPENDPLAKRIREELRLANEHYMWLLKESQKKKEPGPSEIFDQKGGNLLERLERFWKILNERVHGSVPMRAEELDALFKQHKAFEDQLEGTDNEVSTVKHLFGTIEDPSPMQRQRMQRIMELWESLWSVSKNYVQRLKSLEDLFVIIQEAEQILKHNEKMLVDAGPLPSDLEKLRALQSRLLELQLVLQQKQSLFDQLANVASSVRRSVAASRGSAHSTSDVDRLDDKIQAVIVRWENLGAQVMERLKSVELACQIIMSYRPAYDTELAWLDGVERRINNLRKPEELHPEELQHELERLMADYNSVKEHSRAIENVNHEGGRYIREGRSYDSSVQSFRERYSESFSFYSSGETPGADIVTRELEELNRRFARLPNIIMDRYKLVQMLLERWRADMAVHHEHHQRREYTITLRADEERRRREAEDAERERLRREEEERRRREEEERRRREEEERERERLRREEEERRRREEEERERERLRREEEERERERLRREEEERERERLRREEEERRRREEEERERQMRLRLEMERQQKEDEDRERERERLRREEEERRRREEEERERERERLRREEEERQRQMHMRVELERQQKDDDDRERERERLRREEEERRRREEEERRRREEEERERDRLRREQEDRDRYAREEEERRRREEAERLRALEEAERLRRQMEEEARARMVEDETLDKIVIEETVTVRTQDERRPPTPPPPKPPSPVLNVQRPFQISTGEVIETTDTFEVIRDRDEARQTEHEDEMQMYEEWTETKVQFYELEAILHKQTGEILTFVEALRQGLLDLHSGSGEFFDLVSGSKISLEDAVNRGFISQSFQECLNTDYGIRDARSGESLTLLQAIQRRIYDPECRQLRDPVSGDLLSMEDAVFKKVISFQDVHRLVKMGILKLPPVSLENAMENRMIDLETGMFRGRVTHESIPLREALRNEYITLSSPLPPMIAVSLSEAIADRFIDLKTGEFKDKNTESVITLKEATNRLHPVLNMNVKEIVDTKERKRISLGEAVVRAGEKQIIDARKATFKDRKSNHTLTLDEAYSQELIMRPLTLTEIVQKQWIDSQGRFVDPHTQRRLTLLEAVCEGMVDADVEHIFDVDGQEVVSVQEALERGVLDPVDSCLLTDKEGARLALIEAMREGHLRARQNHFLFDIRGIKNTKTFNNVCFTEAVTLGIVDLSSGRIIDLSADESFILADAVERGLIEPMLHSILSSKSEIITGSNQDMTIFEAVCRGYIDYQKGVFKDARSGASYGPREAYEQGLVSLKGAMLLRSIFNVSPQLTIPPKVVRQAQYQRRKKKPKQGSGDKDKVKITLAEAMRKGLIDAKTQRFRQGETEMSLQEALSQGMIDPQSEWIVPKSSPFSHSPAIQETITEQVSETSEQLAPRSHGDTKNLDETVTTVRRGRTTETTAIGAPGGVAAYRAVGHGETGVFEIPVDGWHVLEAEELGYVNLDTGMMSIPNTNKTLTLKQALGLNLIRCQDIQFTDPNGKEAVNLYDAILKGKVGSTGHVTDIRTGHQMTFRGAVESGLFRLAPKAQRIPGGKMRVLNFGVPSSSLADAGAGTASYQESQSAWSFDAQTGEVFDGVHGDTLSLDDALRHGRVPEDAFVIRDPTSGRELVLPEAVKWGLVDQSTLLYCYGDQRHSLKEAARRGWLRAKGPAADESPRNESLRTTVRQQTRTVTASKEPPPSGPSIYLNTTLEELVDEGNFNDFTGCFVHSNTGANFTMQEALQLGYFNPYDVEVLDTQQDQRVPLLNAVQYGLVDTTSGLYMNKQANTTTQLREALSQGLIRSRHGVTAVAPLPAGSGTAPPKGSFSPQYPGKERQELVEVAPGKKALVKVIRDSTGVEKGEYLDESGMKFTVSLRGDPYASQSKTTVKSSSQVKQVELEPYAEMVGLDEVRDNRTGRVMSLSDAERAGIAKTENKGRQVTKSYAVYRSNIQKALLEGVTDAVTQARIGLEQAVRDGHLDLNRLQYRNALNGEFVSLSRAANMGLIDMTLAEVLPKGICDPNTGEMIPLDKALQEGIVNSRTAELRDRSGSKLTWLEVLRPVYASVSSEGIFDPRRGHHVPVVSAINEGLIDLTAEVYKNPITNERYNMEDAQKRNLIDEDTLRILTERQIYSFSSKQNISLLAAVREGVVNIKDKTVRLGPDEIERIAIAVQKGRFPKKVGEKLSNIGRWSFVEALGKGFIDLQANQFTDPDTDVTMTISDAVQAGYVRDLDGQNGQDIRNLAVIVNTTTDFDEASGKIFDRKSNQQLGLVEATRRGILDDQSLLYETDSGSTLTLREALDQGILDSGSRYTCRQSGAKMPIKQAVTDGFLALIASPMQASVAVAEAVRRRDREGFRFRLEQAPESMGSSTAGGTETTYTASYHSGPVPAPRSTDGSSSVRVTETVTRKMEGGSWV